MNEAYSPIRNGAESGVALGLYFCAIFFCIVLAPSMPLLSLPGLVLMVGLPFFVYRLMRKQFVVNEGGLTYSDLTGFGLMAFVFGGLICSVVTISYLKYIDPCFIVNQVKSCAEVYSSLGSPEAQQIGVQFQSMINHGQVPTAASFVVSMFCFTVALGILISLIDAAVARNGKLPKQASKKSDTLFQSSKK